MGEFRAGTSGWSYQDWAKGVFYPEGVRPGRWLEYYATQFDCVELNASFYRMPQEQTLKDWQARAPDHFKFCPKMSRFITQLKKLRDVERPLSTFFERFDNIKSGLGPVLIQLPPSLGFHRDRTEHFFQLLQPHRDYRFALEVRHKTWLGEEALGLLRQYDIALVISQSDGRFPYSETVTTDFVYLRFHGPGALYASDYAQDMLADYALKIKTWLKEVHAAWAFFNNDLFAYAVKNARQLREMVEG
jgi:uncharacterized protein YecE (DUF72 family)